MSTDYSVPDQDLDVLCAPSTAQVYLHRWVKSDFMPHPADTAHPFAQQCYDSPLPDGYKPPNANTCRHWVYLGDVYDRSGAKPIERDTWHMAFCRTVGTDRWMFYVPVGFIWDRGRPTSAWSQAAEATMRSIAGSGRQK